MREFRQGCGDFEEVGKSSKGLSPRAVVRLCVCRALGRRFRRGVDGILRRSGRHPRRRRPAGAREVSGPRCPRSGRRPAPWSPTQRRVAAGDPAGISGTSGHRGTAATARQPSAETATDTARLRPVPSRAAVQGATLAPARLPTAAATSSSPSRGTTPRPPRTEAAATPPTARYPPGAREAGAGDLRGDDPGVGPFQLPVRGRGRHDRLGRAVEEDLGDTGEEGEQYEHRQGHPPGHHVRAQQLWHRAAHPPRSGVDEGWEEPGRAPRAVAHGADRVGGDQPAERRCAKANEAKGTARHAPVPGPPPNPRTPNRLYAFFPRPPMKRSRGREQRLTPNCRACHIR